MNRMWKNVELEKSEAEKLKAFLKRARIDYEPSSADNLVHFEIYLNRFETQLVNEFLDTL